MSEREFPIWAAGKVLPAYTPVIAAEDQGFLLGLAVFETILVENGHPYFLDAHLDRLIAGAVELGIDHAAVDARAALAELTAEIRAGASSAADDAFAARITLSRGVPGRGPVLIVTARECVAPPATGAVLYVSPLRAHSDPLATVKSTSRLRYILARAEAEEHGAWEALLLNANGDLAEGTVSNVFLVRDGRLATPPTGDGALGGIMRATILTHVAAHPSVGAVAVERLPLDALEHADEVFLTNTTGRVIPVSRVLFAPEFGARHSTREYPGARGPVAASVRTQIDALEAQDRARGD